MEGDRCNDTEPFARFECAHTHTSLFAILCNILCVNAPASRGAALCTLNYDGQSIPSVPPARSVNTIKMDSFFRIPVLRKPRRFKISRGKTQALITTCRRNATHNIQLIARNVCAAAFLLTLDRHLDAKLRFCEKPPTRVCATFMRFAYPRVSIGIKLTSGHKVGKNADGNLDNCEGCSLDRKTSSLFCKNPFG